MNECMWLTMEVVKMFRSLRKILFGVVVFLFATVAPVSAQDATVSILPIGLVTSPSSRSGWQEVLVDFALANPTNEWRGYRFNSNYFNRNGAYTGSYFTSSESRQQQVVWAYEYPTLTEVLLPPGFVVYGSRTEETFTPIFGEIPQNMSNLELTLSPYWEWVFPDFTETTKSIDGPISLTGNDLVVPDSISFPLMHPLSYDALNTDETIAIAGDQVSINFSLPYRDVGGVIFRLGITSENLLGDTPIYVKGWLAGSDGIVHTWDTSNCTSLFPALGPGQTANCPIEIRDIPRNASNLFAWFIVSDRMFSYATPNSNPAYIGVLDLTNLVVESLPSITIEGCELGGHYQCTIKNNTSSAIDLSEWAFCSEPSGGCIIMGPPPPGMILDTTFEPLGRSLEAGELWEFTADFAFELERWPHLLFQLYDRHPVDNGNLVDVYRLGIRSTLNQTETVSPQQQTLVPSDALAAFIAYLDLRNREQYEEAYELVCPQIRPTLDLEAQQASIEQAGITRIDDSKVQYELGSLSGDTISIFVSGTVDVYFQDGRVETVPASGSILMRYVDRWTYCGDQP